MLRGDRAELADVLPAAEAVLEEVHLIHDLPRVDQELLTLTRYGELAPAVEDPDAELVLDLLKGRREAGLGDEEPFGSKAYRAAFCNGENVSYLLKSHALTLEELCQMPGHGPLRILASAGKSPERFLAGTCFLRAEGSAAERVRLLSGRTEFSAAPMLKWRSLIHRLRCSQLNFRAFLRQAILHPHPRRASRRNQD